MKFPKLILFVMLATFAVGAIPQSVAAQDGPAFAASSETVSASSFREEVAQGIVEKAEKSDELTRFEKRRVRRVMNDRWWNQWRRDRVVDQVVKQLIQSEQVVVTPDGVQAAVDWDSVLAFIEKLIPLILQLVSLFGG